MTAATDSYRVLQVECCASCKHLWPGVATVDGTCLRRSIHDATTRVVALGVCDEYERGTGPA